MSGEKKNTDMEVETAKGDHTTEKWTRLLLSDPRLLVSWGMTNQIVITAPVSEVAKAQDGCKQTGVSFPKCR